MGVKHLIGCAMLLFGLTLAQGIELKNLYNGIEDMALESRQFRAAPRPERESIPEPSFQQETALVERQIGAGIFRFCNPGAINSKVNAEDGVKWFTVNRVVSGSFTRAVAKQELYMLNLCEMGQGLVILENKKVVADYGLQEHAFYNFTVSDINKNGLNELMFVVGTQRGGISSWLRELQLYEFGNAKQVALGAIFLGGPSGLWADGGTPPDDLCQPGAPKGYRTTFPSNNIYVYKNKSPQFFAETFEVNCDYLKNGVRARKISNLTTIKLEPRTSILKRLY